MSSSRVLPGALLPDDPPLESFHLQLEPVPRVVAAGRAFIREHTPPVPAETLDVLLLLTSELVTNAVLHARTPIELGITIAGRSLVITVHDEDLAPPEQQPDDEREGGWGLGLVRSLSDECALDVHVGDGKTAWFRLARGETRQAEPGSAGRPGEVELGQAGTPTPA